MASTTKTVPPVRKRCNPHVVLLKVVLMGTQANFEYPGLLDDKRMDHAMQAGKEIMAYSQKKAEVRQVPLSLFFTLALGLSHDVWAGLARVFTHAIPWLERQSLAISTPPTAGYDASGTNYVSGNFLPLLKEIERVNDLCIVARNILATKSEAQDLAAETRFDQLILRLIDVCVRVTARGYEGETIDRSEEKWQKVVTAYKKLLITCLQFLHNFVMNNERRKLLLWMDLFGSSPCADPSFMGRVDPAAYFHPGDDLVKELASDAATRISGAPDESRHAADGSDTQERLRKRVESLSKEIENSIGPDIEALREEMAMDETEQRLEKVVLNDRDVKIDATAGDATTATTGGHGESSAPVTSDDKSSSSPTSTVKDRAGVGALGYQKNKDRSIDRTESLFTEGEAAALPQRALGLSPSTLNGRAVVSPILNASNFTAIGSSASTAPEDDTKMTWTPNIAAQNLNNAKGQLLDGLRPGEEVQMSGEHGEVHEGEEEGDDQTDDQDEDVDGSEAAADGSVEDDDDLYTGPGDQERGLLTDVPLVLGPNEIEALPMIIQTGIVDQFATKNPEGINENMQAIRCNILVSQESGRNLLRELLIFVAAWDLADDEIYFKMMIQIMEALLTNGLVPYTYGAFQEAKDIISPSQAVIIKLLTQIFRARQALAASNSTTSSSQVPRSVQRVDILVVRYIFTQFRQSVIPETCALIYLQGQIRAGYVHPEDFPLNLWDMERVYEGVYQFLEFFAVLTEAEEWKSLLIEWEITFELVTLLKELETGIPKGGLVKKGSAATNAIPDVKVAPPASAPAGGNQQQPSKPVAVERPYDPNPQSDAISPNDTSPPSPTPLGTDDPSDFEWRNLKKLVVLVLSSLIWHSPTVQNQVRSHGGVEVILSCCGYDAHNPYIREHAIMCLRFLLEGNSVNQQVVRGLELKYPNPDGDQSEGQASGEGGTTEGEKKRGKGKATLQGAVPAAGPANGTVSANSSGNTTGIPVPKEVLDKSGYETFIDAKGKVGLRRKDGGAAEGGATATGGEKTSLAVDP
ncbi:MAG: copper transport protein [Caeruleum heppii]|nr:MAG: copper transport protein [Caeruleum heppii]